MIRFCLAVVQVIAKSTSQTWKNKHRSKVTVDTKVRSVKITRLIVWLNVVVDDWHWWEEEYVYQSIIRWLMRRIGDDRREKNGFRIYADTISMTTGKHFSQLTIHTNRSRPHLFTVCLGCMQFRLGQSRRHITSMGYSSTGLCQCHCCTPVKYASPTAHVLFDSHSELNFLRTSF